MADVKAGSGRTGVIAARLLYVISIFGSRFIFPFVAAALLSVLILGPKILLPGMGRDFKQDIWMQIINNITWGAFKCFAGIAFLTLLYKAWASLQGSYPRVKPLGVILRLFIPVYGLYWWFRALGGFARDYNRNVEAFKIPAQRLPAAPFYTYGALFLILLTMPLFLTIVPRWFHVIFPNAFAIFEIYIVVKLFNAYKAAAGFPFNAAPGGYNPHPTRDLAVIVAFGLAFPLALVAFKGWVAQTTYIAGDVMQDELLPGDYVLSSRITYHFHPPGRGDVVLYNWGSPSQEIGFGETVSAALRYIPAAYRGSIPSFALGRVVGVPGDELLMRGGRLFRNGQVVSEPVEPEGGKVDWGPSTVPSGRVFIIRDRRTDDMADSRIRGDVSVDAIYAKVELVCISVAPRGCPRHHVMPVADGPILRCAEGGEVLRPGVDVAPPGTSLPYIRWNRTGKLVR